MSGCASSRERSAASRRSRTAALLSSDCSASSTSRAHLAAVSSVSPERDVSSTVAKPKRRRERGILFQALSLSLSLSLSWKKRALEAERAAPSPRAPTRAPRAAVFEPFCLLESKSKFSNRHAGRCSRRESARWARRARRFSFRVRPRELGHARSVRFGLRSSARSSLEKEAKSPRRRLADAARAPWRESAARALPPTRSSSLDAVRACSLSRKRERDRGGCCS